MTLAGHDVRFVGPIGPRALALSVGPPLSAALLSIIVSTYDAYMCGPWESIGEVWSCSPLKSEINIFCFDWVSGLGLFSFAGFSVGGVFLLSPHSSGNWPRLAATVV